MLAMQYNFPLPADYPQPHHPSLTTRCRGLTVMIDIDIDIDNYYQLKSFNYDPQDTDRQGQSLCHCRLSHLTPPLAASSAVAPPG